MPSLWENDGLLIERNGILLEGTEAECCTCVGIEYGCTCGQCIDSLAPAFMRVTFSGVVAKDPQECAACDDWNLAGGHKIPQWEVDCCFWLGQNDGGISGYALVSTIPCTGAIEIYAAGDGFECVAHENGVVSARFANTYPAFQTPCITGATLALDSPPNSADCDWSSATCTVVAWEP
jgi:hypothetical protein